MQVLHISNSQQRSCRYSSHSFSDLMAISHCTISYASHIAPRPVNMPMSLWSLQHVWVNLEGRWGDRTQGTGRNVGPIRTRKWSSDNPWDPNSDLGTRSFFPGSLSPNFLSMDCYPSIAHFADFQVHSSRSIALKNTSDSLLLRSTKTPNRS